MQRKKDARQIHRDRALPGLLGGGAKLHLLSNAGVGDHDIGRAGLIEGALERRAVRDVHRISGAAKLRGGSGRIRVLQIENRDARATLRQHAGRGRADAVRAAGNHGDLAREIKAHLIVIPWTALQAEAARRVHA